MFNIVDKTSNEVKSITVNDIDEVKVEYEDKFFTGTGPAGYYGLWLVTNEKLIYFDDVKKDIYSWGYETDRTIIDAKEVDVTLVVNNKENE